MFKEPTTNSIRSFLRTVFSCFGCLVFLSLLAMVPAWGEDDPDPKQALIEWAEVAESVQDLLKNPEANAEKLNDEFHERLLSIGNAARTLADEKAAELEPLSAQRAALAGTDEPGPENFSLIREREKLDWLIADVTAIRNQADREAKRANSLIASIASVRRRVFTDSLLTRGPSPANPEAWSALWSSLQDTGVDLKRGVRNLAAGIDDPVQALSLVLIGVLAALVIGIVIQRRVDDTMRRLYKRKRSTSKRRFLYAVLFTLQRVIVMLSAILVGTVFVAMSADFTDAQAEGLIVIPIVLVALAISYALVLAIFSPNEGSLRIVDFDNDLACGLVRNILIVMIILSLNTIVIETGKLQDWPREALAVANFLVVSLASMFFYRIAQMVSRSTLMMTSSDSSEISDDTEEDPDNDTLAESGGTLDFRRILGGLALAVGFAALVASLLGYFALSRYFLSGVIRSGGLIGVCLVLFSAFSQVGAITFGRPAQDDDDPQAPWWFTLLVGVLLTIFAIPLLAAIWGASANDITLVSTKMLEGIEIGGVKLAPVHFLFALLVLPGLLVVTRIAKRYLAQHILPRTSLDVGARTSIVAGAGYVGVIFAVLVTMSVAGFDLSKLALVAGALSVGIGFGLQNIVGNFVSGLILLIERPIKTGDWVVVGGQHGTVKRIDVRATQIDTFDRSTLIVPNTELITTTVENWTHRNNVGRVIVPVGVAYGTDPVKVQKVLEEIAAENTMILRRPEPMALFRGFGDHALKFELRGYLKDINNIFFVENDVCLAIDRRFKEEGIVIPLPQRVVHLQTSESSTVPASLGESQDTKPT